MKTDLATSIAVAIIGVLVAYFVCDFIVQPIQTAQIKTVDTSVSSNIEEPSIDVFNPKTLNPTVEVYVGNCTEYNENGECKDGSIIENYDAEDFSEDEEANNNQNTAAEEQETP